MGEIAFELSVLALTVFLYVVANLSDTPNPISVMRPYWWPKMILGITLIVCSGLLYLSLKELKRVNKVPKREAQVKAWPWLVAQVVSITALVAFQNILGFLTSSFLFGVISCFIIDGKFKLMHILISLMVSFSLTLFFGSVMGVVLPRGLGIFRALSFYLY